VRPRPRICAPPSPWPISRRSTGWRRGTKRSSFPRGAPPQAPRAIAACGRCALRLELRATPTARPQDAAV
jgi:hypothetical protein